MVNVQRDYEGFFMTVPIVEQNFTDTVQNFLKSEIEYLDFDVKSKFVLTKDSKDADKMSPKAELKEGGKDFQGEASSDMNTFIKIQYEA